MDPPGSDHESTADALATLKELEIAPVMSSKSRVLNRSVADAAQAQGSMHLPLLPAILEQHNRRHQTVNLAELSIKLHRYDCQGSEAFDDDNLSDSSEEVSL
jgi:hypothetical protein